ncbi:MAG: ABC transporter permease, partial [Chlamydiae bacterium]|nr:ABC transporter permease [Chlamydiota bacterium]
QASYLLQFADVLYSIPYLLVVILLTTWIGPGFSSLLIALTVTGWIKMARILRSRFLQVKQMAFVQAALVLGASRKRILFSHLLPNSAGQILVTLTLTIPSAIFTEAFLSFLGLGIQAPFASLGVMTSDALTAIPAYPWRLFFPAGCITLTLLALCFVGEGLRDALDTREYT